MNLKPNIQLTKAELSWNPLSTPIPLQALDLLQALWEERGGKFHYYGSNKGLTLSNPDNATYKYQLDPHPVGYIAGGFARWILDPAHSPLPSDIDIFCWRDSDLYYDAIDTDEFELGGRVVDAVLNLGYEQSRDLPNAVEFILPTHTAAELYGGDGTGLTAPFKIQLIKPFKNEYMQTYGSPEQLLSQFDFTVAQAAILYNPDPVLLESYPSYHLTPYDYNSTVLFSVTSNLFYSDNAAHRLNITHINCPVAVALRVQKFASKGYFASPRELAKLFLEWESRPQSWKDRLINLLDRSGNLSPSEWIEMEKLLRLD